MIATYVNKKTYLYIIPIIIVLWGVFINHYSGPFYLSRIDPEFPYLLNGLNAAFPEFNRIGHIDHPGTPFQLLTGIFIRLFYWVSGKGNIVESVISNPEIYLSWSSYMLSIITAIVIFILGKIVYNNSGRLGESLILQSSLFLNIVLIEIFPRYNPDRALIIYTLVFVIICYKFLYKEKFTSRKMALYSGIIMGLGFITKISYFPLLIIPFILISGYKNRLIYIGTFIVVSFILLIPVLNRIDDMYQFIFGMATHDGLYGKGNEQIVNLDTFVRNLYLIFRLNISFCVILFTSLVTFIVLLIKPKLRAHNKKEYLLYIAFLLATLISIILVSKHFKNYYLAPVISLSGLMFYVFWKLNEKKKYVKLILSITLLILIAIPVYSFIRKIPIGINNKKANEVSRFFVKNHISSDSYILIEPSWQSAPFIENGLVYGNSYVRHKHSYYKEYKKIYPNVITYEGRDIPLKYFRMIDVETESILKSGLDIYIYSSPYRNTGEVLDYLNKQAYKAGIKLNIDTVFSNDYNEDVFIKVGNASNWRIVNSQNCGFEKYDNNSLLTDDELTSVQGNYVLNQLDVYDGLNSIVLDSIYWFGPKIKLYNVVKGDYLEAEIKLKTKEDNDEWSLGISSTKPYLDDLYYLQRKSVGYINDKWQIVRLALTIPIQPADSVLDVFFQNKGNGKVYLDDFEVRHYTDR